MTIVEPETDPTVVDRRALLRRAGLLAGGAVAAGAAATAVVASPASADTEPGNGPAGSWLLTGPDPAGFSVPQAWTFHPGGALTEQNLVPANIVLWGAWASTRGGFRYTMWGGVPGENDGPGVLFRVTGTGTIARRVLTTSWTATFVDPATMADLFTFSGSSSGGRIEA